MYSNKQQSLDRAIARLSTTPLADQNLNEICELFEGAQDLTNIFVGRSEVRGHQFDEYGQNYISALELASCASRGMPFCRPIQFEPETDNADGEISEYRQQIQRETEARVRELQSRADTSFILLWAIEGSEEIHSVASSGYSYSEIRSELTEFFSNLIFEYIV